MKRFFLVVFISCILFASCNSNNYYYFTDEELNLIPYEAEDVLKYVITPDNDSVDFQVVSKEIYHEEAQYALNPSPNYVHVCKVVIEAINGMDMEIKYVKSLEGFSFEIYITNSVENWHEAFFYETEVADDADLIDDFEVDGELYDDVFILSTPNDTLYYSGDNGVLMFSVNETMETYIVETQYK